MINYSVNNDIRTKVTLFFALSSVAFYILLINTFSPSLLITLIITIFFLFYWFFDNYIWKMEIFHSLLGVPDFTGRWVGAIDSEELDESKKVNVFITQTWSKISIILEDNDTNVRSNSNGAYITLHGKNVKFLSYSYDFENSKGFCELRYDNNYKKDKLIGSYFTSLPTKGKIKLGKK